MIIKEKYRTFQVHNYFLHKIYLTLDDLDFMTFWQSKLVSKYEFTAYRLPFIL